MLEDLVMLEAILQLKVMLGEMEKVLINFQEAVEEVHHKLVKMLLLLNQIIGQEMVVKEQHLLFLDHLKYMVQAAAADQGTMLLYQQELELVEQMLEMVESENHLNQIML